MMVNALTSDFIDGYDGPWAFLYLENKQIFLMNKNDLQFFLSITSEEMHKSAIPLNLPKNYI